MPHQGVTAPQPSHDAPVAAPPSLEWLLHPVPVETFLSEYWEKKPLHISRNDPGYYSRLFSLEELDELIGKWLTNEEIRMARNCQTIFPQDHGKGRTSICEFYERYYEGNTIVVRNIHLGWEPIAALGSELGRTFGCRLNTHLYPTPDGMQGFGTHWDDHDILALQLEGEKEWCLYDSGPEVPRYSNVARDYRKRIYKGEAAEALELTHEITLRAGDLLYFPRGKIHRARAQRTSSMHLNFGLFPETWEHLIVKAIRNLARREPALTRALPVGFHSGALDLQSVQEKLRHLLPLVQDGLDFDEAYQTLAVDVIRRIPQVTAGHFGQLLGPRAIDATTLVEKCQGMITAVIADADHAALHFPGGEHRAAIGQLAALRFIHAHERFRVADIAGADDGTLALVRALIGKGVLRCAGTSSDTEKTAP